MNFKKVRKYFVELEIVQTIKDHIEKDGFVLFFFYLNIFDRSICITLANRRQKEMIIAGCKPHHTPTKRLN